MFVVAYHSWLGFCALPCCLCVAVVVVWLLWLSFRMGDAVYDALRCDHKEEEDDLEKARREEEAEARLEAALTGGGDPDTKTDAADADGATKKPKRQAFEVSQGKSKDDDDSENEKPDDQIHWPFHLVMALGGLYFGMLLTNWGSLQR